VTQNTWISLVDAGYNLLAQRPADKLYPNFSPNPDQRYAAVPLVPFDSDGCYQARVDFKPVAGLNDQITEAVHG
jgi:hypothetical protein